MKDKRKDSRKIIQWLAFAVAIATSSLYGILFATGLTRDIPMEKINIWVLIGYTTSAILIVLSYSVKKK